MRYIHKISKDKDVIVLIDTTYWGRNFGLMVIKDAYRNKILWYKFVYHETISDYKEGIEYLREKGFTIYTLLATALTSLTNSMTLTKANLTVKRISLDISLTNVMTLKRCWVIFHITSTTMLSHAICLCAITSTIMDMFSEDKSSCK